MIIKNCLTCGKEFKALSCNVKRGWGKFCSPACHYENMRSANNPCRKLKIKKVCLICGKKFEVVPALNKNGRAKNCSRKCQSIWQSKYRVGENSNRWRGGKITRQCLVCKKEFQVIPAVVKKGNGNFCSPSCKAIKQMKSDHTKQTLIELKVEEYLTKLGIVFESQKVIPEGKTIADFFIPAQRLVIYADGTFWHKSKWAKEHGKVSHDDNQNFLLGMNGYKVLRLPEKEIKDGQFSKRINKCLAQ